MGLPKTIQSNQGSNCISHLFQQVMHELKIKEFKSNAYHPESQVTLERFHDTLKNIMKTFVSTVIKIGIMGSACYCLL